jgi:hypothetical protein
MPYTLSSHAQQRIAERGLDAATAQNERRGTR